MATRTTTTNRFYMKYAEREMLIDEGEQGLFCDVPIGIKLSGSDKQSSFWHHKDEH